jgi:hypothetical protein
MRDLIVVLLGVILMCSLAYGGRRADSVPLNGAWEFALGNGDERAEMADGAAKLAWRPARLPGPFVPWTDENATKVRFAWARCTFTVTPAQVRRLAVLRWNQIDFSAVAFINGRKVGENEPTGPYQVMLPAGPPAARRERDRAVHPRRGRSAQRRERQDAHSRGLRQLGPARRSRGA